MRFNRIIFEMDKHINFKKVFFAFYCLVGIYVAAMYLLSAFRGDTRSYGIMMNLSLALGFFSGIVFVEAEKKRRWLLSVFLGVLWVAGFVIDYVQSSESGLWNKNHIILGTYYLLGFFLPILVIWALSRIKKGRNVIKSFVGAVFALSSLGFLPGRGKLEPLYDILFVALPMITFAIVAQNQSKPQRWVSLLVFLAVYSYTLIANLYINLAMFVIVAVALMLVMGILSASWNCKTKNAVFVVSACLMAVIAVMAIPTWGSYALQRYVYSEHAIPVGKPLELENAFIAPDNDTVPLESLRGKTVVLYFWSASCGTCHVMMPEYSAFAESYADDPDKVFYAVFLKSKNENDSKHYEEMTREDHAFHWLMALEAKEVMKKLEFNTFPHLTIISPDGTVAYNGNADFNRTNVYSPRKHLSFATEKHLVSDEEHKPHKALLFAKARFHEMARSRCRKPFIRSARWRFWPR